MVPLESTVSDNDLKLKKVQQKAAKMLTLPRGIQEVLWGTRTADNEGEKTGAGP
jgi:hypothetical protein